MNSRDFWVSDTHKLRLATRTGDLVILKEICSDSSWTAWHRLCGRDW